jgi:hypothetical protein
VIVIEEKAANRLSARWARLRDFLIQHPELAFRTYDILHALDARVADGLALARAMRADARLTRLEQREWRNAHRAATEDWRSIRAGKLDLLGRNLTARLGHSDSPLSAPNTATTSFEAEEDLRPRFASVEDDFISHHTETMGVGAVHLANALEARGRSCFVAQRNIARPQDWNDVLLPAIRSCREFLLLMNRAAASSKRVKGEVHVAVESGRRVVAVVLEENVGVENFDVGLKATQVAIVQWQRPLQTIEDARSLAASILDVLAAEQAALCLNDRP